MATHLDRESIERLMIRLAKAATCYYYSSSRCDGICFYFLTSITNTSAVSSIHLGSILVFASCVIRRPLVFADVLFFVRIYIYLTPLDIARLN